MKGSRYSKGGGGIRFGLGEWLSGCLKGLVFAWLSCLLTAGAANPLLVIIDTGVSAAQFEPVGAALHGAFASKTGNNVPSGETPHWDFLENDAEPQDLSGHGTHVSGIAWHQLKAHRSPRPGCLVMLRAGRDRLKGEHLVAALRRVGKLRADGSNVAVLLCAFTLESEDTGAAVFEEFRKTATGLMDDGLIIVAAAGGTGVDLDQLAAGQDILPASIKHRNLIVVTSCSEDGQLAPRANTGRRQVALAAPGTRIESCWLHGATKRLSGSSQAAALVAADVLEAVRRARASGEEFQLDALLAARGIHHPSLLQTTRSGRFLRALPAPGSGGNDGE